MGTWALPQTVKKAKELQELMKLPLPAKIASNRLYDLIGDDNLFDKIISVENECGKDRDVRDLVKFSLKSFLENRDLSNSSWNKNSLKICHQICNLSC
jgi:hypothetical protein